VLIGPPETLEGLRDRFEAGADVTTFTDAEALEALDHILRTKPRLVALEREFSSGSRGTAFINRIKDDPALAGCEVRVVTRDSEVVAVKRGPGAGGTAVAVEEPSSALDQRGTRRAPRYRIRDGVDVTVGGNPSTLVDLSTVGAQVISPTVLKPNQRVVLIMNNGKAPVRCAGAIAWASFEMPKGQPPRYRAGIDFQNVDADAINAFIEKYRRD
jgi:hypothetical protein